MITPSSGGRASDVFFEPQRRDHRTNVIVDLRGRTSAVHPPEQTLLVVVLDQGRGLLVVDAEAVPNHLGLVVIALDQARPVLITNPLPLGRVELDRVVVAWFDP